MDDRVSRLWSVLRGRRPRRRLLSAIAIVTLISFVAVYRTTGWAQSEDEYPVLDVDLTEPDVLIRTRSLSSLLRDLLQVPLAKDLLGEDVVFYYETHPDRLGLVGSLRRMAYEHELSWTDQIVSTVFDEPAEVMLWRGPKGALDHWALAMNRGSLATVLQEAATIATKDRQLTRAGELTVDETRVAVYALEYAPSQTLLIVSRGDRVVVLSEPGLIGDGQRGFRPDPVQAVSALLSADERQRHVFDRTFPPNRGGLTHSIAARLNFLSFGYQRFFPGVDALEFGFGNGQWSTSLLVNGAALPDPTIADHGLWSAVPANAALCAMLPVDWSRGGELAGAIASDAPRSGDLSQELDGPAIACWYDEAPMHAPLIVATLKNPRPAVDALLQDLFNWSIKKPKGGGTTTREAGRDAATWRQDVNVPYSSVDPETGRPVPGTLSVTLAVQGRQVFFSPDEAQVSRALDTVAKRYPSMADTLPRDGISLATIRPAALATLGRREALTMLPRADEPVFRTAAEQRLLPKLDLLARYPPYRLTLNASDGRARRWEPVRWQELAR